MFPDDFTMAPCVIEGNPRPRWQEVGAPDGGPLPQPPLNLLIREGLSSGSFPPAHLMFQGNADRSGVSAV